MSDDLAPFGRTLVIAPHPDDEVLGVGGTIARLARAGQEVCVAVVTTGQVSDYAEADIARVQGEALKAHEMLGVHRTLWLDQPAARLSETPHIALNAALRGAVQEVRPDTLILPFVGDIHRDHQLAFLSGLVAARPNTGEYPTLVLAYETLSETNWNAPYVTPGFVPNVFVDIADTLELKLDAMAAFTSQVQAFPHERSLEALQALAMLRGATFHCHAAEAFVLIRHIFRSRPEPQGGPL